MEKLRELRLLADLTQFELARRSNVDRTRLCLAEKGYVRLRAEQERAVREALLSAIRERNGEIEAVLAAI